MKFEVVLSSRKVLKTKQGAGPPGPRFVDFPCARGLQPIQGFNGGAAAARQRHGFFGNDVFVILKDLVVIFVFPEVVHH